MVSMSGNQVNNLLDIYLPSSLVKIIVEVSFPGPLELIASTLMLYGIPASKHHKIPTLINIKILTSTSSAYQG